MAAFFKRTWDFKTKSWSRNNGGNKFRGRGWFPFFSRIETIDNHNTASFINSYVPLVVLVLQNLPFKIEEK